MVVLHRVNEPIYLAHGTSFRVRLALLEYDREAIEQVVHDFAEQQRLEDERM